MGLKSRGNGVILQNRPMECVVMDVHKKCLYTWGANNYQTLKRNLNISNYHGLQEGMIERGVRPFQRKKHTPPKWVY